MSGTAALLAALMNSVRYFLPSGMHLDSGDGNPASMALSLFANGTGNTQGATAGTATFNWITPTSFAPGAYTIRVHVTSGTFSSSSGLDADLALTSNRSWTVEQSTPGAKETTAELTLKDGGGATVAFTTITLRATM